MYAGKSVTICFDNQISHCGVAGGGGRGQAGAKQEDVYLRPGVRFCGDESFGLREVRWAGRTPAGWGQCRSYREGLVIPLDGNGKRSVH